MDTDKKNTSEHLGMFQNWFYEILTDICLIYGVETKNWIVSHHVSELEKCEIGSILNFLGGKLTNVECLKLCYIDLMSYLRVKTPEIGGWVAWVNEDDSDSFEIVFDAFSRLHGEDAVYELRRLINLLMRISGHTRTECLKNTLNQQHGNLHTWEDFSRSMELYLASEPPPDFYDNLRGG